MSEHSQGRLEKHAIFLPHAELQRDIFELEGSNPSAYATLRDLMQGHKGTLQELIDKLHDFRGNAAKFAFGDVFFSAHTQAKQSPIVENYNELIELFKKHKLDASRSAGKEKY